MPEKSLDYDSESASSKGADIGVVPEIIERLLRLGLDGPLSTLKKS